MNPIKEVRLDHNLTQRAFASLAGVTEQIVIRAESGMFGTLPPSIVNAVRVFTGQPSMVIIDNYEAWVEKELKEVKLPAASSDHMILDRIQFVEWKVVTCSLNDVPATTVGFCKLFKMHPHVIDKWESGKLKSAPLQLVQRLAHMRGIL
jgi:transcriptional regulator with XRE-family HTH domain